MTNGKICLITGATSGIGKAAAISLASQGAITILVSRNSEKGERVRNEIIKRTKNEEVFVYVADLSLQREIRQLAEQVRTKHPRLDVLLNNAGGIFDKRIVTPDGIEMTLALNHLGYFLLTSLLLPQLKAAPGARIINLSSDAHRVGTLEFTDIGYERGYTAVKAYARSKLLNLLFTYELARHLVGTHVKVNAMHPGAVRSNFGKELSGIGGFVFKYLDVFMRSPEKGADTAIWLASDPSLEGTTGKYFSDRKEKKSSGISYDLGLAKQLWEVSLRMTGLA
jgi:NAD(P)-dependent dehydrogenase (short-subunit alcohol dehydrogenase family)